MIHKHVPRTSLEGAKGVLKQQVSLRELSNKLHDLKQMQPKLHP